MRFLIPFAGMLLVVAPSALQSQRQSVELPSPLDRTVTLALERVSLKDALDEVARQAGTRIAYSRRVVPLDRPVSVQLDAVRVRAALDALLDGTGVAPTLDRSGQILLARDSDSPRARRQRQTGSIVGTVRNANTGAALAGASVTLVGTRFAAETDAGGRYSIAAVPSGTYRLRARMLGYAPGDTSVVVADGQEAVADLLLRTSAIELNPVVAIGYATVQKRDLTGAVASVTAEEFATEAAPTVTLSSGLQGKAAGVQVTTNSGMPGVGVRVRVRGQGSITANSEPLYVIDGLPAEQGVGGTTDAARNPQNNPLMSIDPSEIESIDVLKDVSATAIYGARGANGVVLITTKRGRRGESRVTIESSYGVQEISKTIPVLAAQDFMRLTNEALVNANAAPLYTDAQIAAARTYDYPGMMLRTAQQASQGITLSGGDQRLRYLLSGNYTYQEGIEIGSDFKRYGVRLNLDSDVSDRFRVGTSLSLTRVARNAAAVENGNLGNSANGIQAAMQFAPFAAPRDAAGNWVKTSPTTEPVPNPVATAIELTDLNTTSRMLGNAYGELDLTPQLRVKSTFGGSFQFDGINNFAPRTIQAGGSAGVGWIFSGQSRNLTNENTVTYRRSVGPGSLDVLGGFSVQTFYGDEARADASGFPTDATKEHNLDSGSQLVPPRSDISEWAILSYIGRANYSIAGKYLFTLTGRRDGSSRFGARNKWAFFPSGAFAWRVSDEPFMQDQSLFTDLKLRVSYGQVGNQALDPYQSLSQLGVAWYSDGATEIPALAPGTTMPNPDLRWEQQTQFNAGIDAVLLDGRVALSLDAYRSRTEDLLLTVDVPRTTGYVNQVQNVGSVRNSGVELSLNTVNIQRDRFSWHSALNIAANRNKVLDLGTTLNPAGQRVDVKELFVMARTGNFLGNEPTHVLRVGEPVGSIYGYQVNGLWQEGDGARGLCYLKGAGACTPGEYRIADLNGDSAITSADRTILGQADPKWYGGLRNTLTYGPFSLDAFMTFSYGNKVVNAGKAYGCFVIMQQNERACALDRWTPQNTNTDVPRANNARARRLYSPLVEDGSYLRLQALTLSYELPARLIRGAEAARLFLTGQNLFVITDYTGFDPEVNSEGGDWRRGGIDIGAYPRSRVWNFGASVTF